MKPHITLFLTILISCSSEIASSTLEHDCMHKCNMAIVDCGSNPQGDDEKLDNCVSECFDLQDQSASVGQTCARNYESMYLKGCAAPNFEQDVLF